MVFGHDKRARFGYRRTVGQRMRVTRLSTQQRHSDRVNVFVDGRYRFSLTLDQVLESGIKVGSELDEPQLKELEVLSAEGKLKARTLEWLMIRPRSRRELSIYLRRKGLDEERIAQWCDYFVARKYQDDQSFARWWVMQRQTGKQRSSQFIRTELRSKGVAADTIAAALDESNVTDEDTLRALIEKKRRLARYQDDDKLILYLQRQGFRYSDIREALAGGE